MKKNSNLMIKLLFFITLVFTLIIAANVFLVSVFKIHIHSGKNLEIYASNTNLVNEKILSRRGYIFDKYGNVIAQDAQTYNIICYIDKERYTAKKEPAHVVDPVLTAKVLSSILDMDEMKIYALLTPTDNRTQTELGTKGRNLTKQQKEAIEEYGLPGIGFTKSVQRSYPMGNFASYLIGYSQSDETGHTVGKMGLELFLDDELTGTDGTRSYQSDKDGYILPGMKSEETPSVNGNDVVLTLDKDIQESLETSFKMTHELFNVEKIWGAVVEIDTGKILAWGQDPSFDPNVREIDDYTNYGSQMPYEAGSTMKAFTYAAAIDSGVYQPDTLVDSTDFCYGAKGRTPYRVSCNDTRKIDTPITNAGYRDWGMITYDMGLVYSSNVVTSSILTNLMSEKTYEEYLDKFGFFKKVNSYGIAEYSNVGVKNFTWPRDKLAMTYGQGSTFTMLQILQAYTSIFSDGTMVKPYYIDQIKNPYNGEVLYQAQREVVGNPIKESTALKVQQLMYDAANMDVGTAKYYRIDETSIIAKTGTAQISSGGSYTTAKTISSVMIALPAEDPKYMVYYAFENEYDKNAHAKTEPVKALIQKVAQTYNLSSSIEKAQENNGSDIDNIEKRVTSMPSLINHSLEYANQKLEGSYADVFVFGSGNEVIMQYPDANSILTINSKVFLLTDNNSILMPDMIGWTRKDVTGFWSLTDIAVRLDGYGRVVSQSIPPNTNITKENEIEVKLE